MKWIVHICMLCRSDIVDLPFLVEPVVFPPGENSLVVLISSALDVKHKSSFVDNVVTSELEVLMPDVMSLGESHVSVSSIFTDVHGNLIVSLGLDASGL